jgi:hypothetical protein
VKRIKVALDANVPQRLVRMLQSAFGDQGYEFLWEPDFAAANAKDEVWVAKFRRFGGQIAITGDRNIARRPHQIIAFMESDLIGFFFDSNWGEKDLTFKAAHLVMWWPRIQVHLANCKPQDCWWVPTILRNGAFKKVELPGHVKGQAKKTESSGSG